MSSLALFMLQMAVIVTVTGLCGGLLQKAGQPKVIGEMLGGILLGKSVLGYLFPHATQVLFPPGSLHLLDLVSNLGLVLYLFLEGINLDVDAVWKQRKVAFLVSTLSMGVPLIAGSGLGFLFLERFQGQQHNKTAFILFVGIALSTTAFPVLARILREKLPPGGILAPTALVSAAIADVLGWALLAVALTVLSAGGSFWTLLQRLGVLAAFVLLLLLVLRPLGARLVAFGEVPKMSGLLLGIFLVGTLLCAFATERLGVHALFGAFLAGICLPRVPQWRQHLERTIDPLVSILLLPVFFAVTGIRTQFGALLTPSMMGWSALVLVVAVVTKVGSAYYAARKTGMTPWDSAALGALMNTRGLVDLVVLNIAYSTGVISQNLFSILVLMALVTTAMTSPLLSLLQRWKPVEKQVPVEA
ncbi:MAG: cation:proton antiporter domain-containing protein [Acidobacteriaceae bacterium]